MKAAMMAMTRMGWLVSVLVVCILFLPGSAFARHYSEGEDLLEWVSDMNEAQAISCAMSMIPTIPGVDAIANLAPAAMQPAVAGAIQGAIMGGISDAITGGDGSGALYGGISGGVGGAVGGIINGGNANPSQNLSYMDQVGVNMTASNIGSGLSAVAINEWGMSTESAQFLGMFGSGVAGLTMGSVNARDAHQGSAENYSRGADGEWQYNAPTEGLASMNMGEIVGLTAAQAGIHVGVESALKDKEYAPYVASFAGQTLGTMGFAAISDVAGTREFGEVCDDQFWTQATIDGVSTAITAGAIESGSTPQEAQVWANIGAGLTARTMTDTNGHTNIRNFDLNNINPADQHGLANLGKWAVGSLATAGGQIAAEEMARWAPDEMNPAMANYFTASNAAAAGALMNSAMTGKSASEQYNKSMDNMRGHVFDLNYDPNQIDGQGTGQQNSVYDLTRQNSQLANMAGVGGLTRGGAYIAEQGGDVQDGINRSLAGKFGLGALGDRMENVYGSAIEGNLRGPISSAIVEYVPGVKEVVAPQPRRLTPPNSANQVSQTTPVAPTATLRVPTPEEYSQHTLEADGKYWGKGSDGEWHSWNMNQGGEWQFGEQNMADFTPSQQPDFVNFDMGGIAPVNNVPTPVLNSPSQNSMFHTTGLGFAGSGIDSAMSTGIIGK